MLRASNSKSHASLQLTQSKQRSRTRAKTSRTRTRSQTARSSTVELAPQSLPFTIHTRVPSCYWTHSTRSHSFRPPRPSLSLAPTACRRSLPPWRPPSDAPVQLGGAGAARAEARDALRADEVDVALQVLLDELTRLQTSQEQACERDPG
eukprot:3805953-Pleurochrysis_carterae.AAC.1